MATKIKKEKKTEDSLKKTSSLKTVEKKNVSEEKKRVSKETKKRKGVKAPASEGSIKRVVSKTESKTRKTKGSVKKNKSKKAEQEYFLRWKGPDFIRTIGEEYLYRGGFVVSILVTISSLLAANFLTALTFLVLAVVLVLELRSKTREIEYEVNLKGVVIGASFLQFSDIRSFDISSKAGFNVVRLQMKNAIFPMREIFLAEDHDLEYVKSLFAYFLPEEEQEEKLFNFKANKELSEDEALEKMVDDYMKGRQ